MTRVLTCISCRRVEDRTAQGRTLYCSVCAPIKHREALAAIAKVLKAVRAGDLPHVSTLACADCGAPAKQYDHRDYSKPLEVDPVCIPCNYRRGPALNSVMRALAEAA